MQAAIWRFFLAWRFRLFQRHRYRSLILERVSGLNLLILPEVFNPALFPTGAFLAEQLYEGLIPQNASVLDMGTGSGICALIAAHYTADVVAVDVNSEAVRCTRINCLLNRVEDRVQVCQGDLFEPVGNQRFDRILFNPPYFRGTPADAHDQAWRSDDTVERFAAALEDHLTSDGFALVVLSTNGDLPGFLATFKANNLRVDVVISRDEISETVTVFRLSPEYL